MISLPPAAAWIAARMRSVGAAAADVARHGLIDLLVGGLGGLGEQRGGLHDLTALAVAALGHVVRPPGLLHRVVPVWLRPSMVTTLLPASAPTPA